MPQLRCKGRIRLCGVGILNEVLHLRGVGGELCGICRSSNVSHSFLARYSRCQSGRVTRMAERRFNACGRTFWRGLIFYIQNINHIWSMCSGYLRSMVYRFGCRGQQTQWKHSFLPRNCLNAIHCSNSSILLVNVFLCTMNVSRYSKDI